MYFLLSGEGPTDIGLCAGNAPACEAGGHEAGPMTLITSAYFCAAVAPAKSPFAASAHALALWE